MKTTVYIINDLDSNTSDYRYKRLSNYRVINNLIIIINYYINDYFEDKRHKRCTVDLVQVFSIVNVKDIRIPNKSYEQFNRGFCHTI